MSASINASTAKIAVITRTKDRALFLERALRSVHQQTMQDFVHVIINDAGDPRAVDKLVRKHKNASRIKVIHNQSSEGIGAALNKAIQSVDSVFIAIHDDDDTWHPDFLARTSKHLESSGAMGVIVTTDRITERLTDNGIETITAERWLPDTHHISLYRMCRDNYATPITFLYRRAAFDAVGYYDPTLEVCEDWDFGLRFLRNYDIDFLDTEQALANYHHRPDATGVVGNSVFAKADLHRRYVNILANRYLRQDLSSGGLGMGFIMNFLRESKRKDEIKDRELIATIEEFRAHNIRVESSLRRTEKLIVEATSPKRFMKGAVRFASRIPSSVMAPVLRKKRI